MTKDYGFISSDTFKPKKENKHGFISSDPISENAPKKESEESGIKSFLRTAYQPISGVLQGTIPGLATNLWQMLATGEVLDPEEIEHIEMIAQREGFPFDKEEYLQKAQEVLSTIPTIPNIERAIEEKTGFPLEAKTRLQKALNISGTGYKLQPGSLSQKVVAGGTAAGTKTGLEELGVPEPLSELIGLGIGVGAGTKTPAIEIGTKTKPSGLPVRRFEKIEKPREVSEKKLGQINEKLESDFRKISDDIIKTSPIEKTATELKENPKFKSEVQEKFKDVEKLAEQIPDKFDTEVVKKKLVDNILKKKGTGFAPSEYDKDYRTFIKDIIKETPQQKITVFDAVTQYRKNNKSLSEYYDPSRTKAYNRAKKDAILDYNRAIADIFEERYPNSEFSNLFKETNKQWAQISDAEAMNDFVDSIFEGKVNFKKGRNFFENEGYARPFKRALGEEGFKNFEQLMSDMLESETPYKMLKVAKQTGWKDFLETAGAYVLSPKLAGAKTAYMFGKKAFRTLMNTLIDKPQLTVIWKNGVDNLKKGNFAEAQRDFGRLDIEVEKAKSASTFSKDPGEIEVKSIKEEPKQITEKTSRKKFQ